MDAGGDPTELEEWLTVLTDYLFYTTEDYGPTALSKATSAEEYEAMMKPMPVEKSKGIDFAAIKERVDIVDHISQYTKLRQVGDKFMGKCPLPGHDDSSASFYVYPKTKSFWCFGCQRGGDVIDFAKHHGLTAGQL